MHPSASAAVAAAAASRRSLSIDTTTNNSRKTSLETSLQSPLGGLGVEMKHNNNSDLNGTWKTNSTHSRQSSLASSAAAEDDSHSQSHSQTHSQQQQQQQPQVLSKQNIKALRVDVSAGPVPLVFSPSTRQ
eukprot:GABV01003029.1.p1 GENE.GABV01003029.1~~GABV01003029.1.p1  ORF type:complete len:131 (-),score=31.61 GABV01003029.1:183-575(-)